ncbi:MAG: hypothetical protein AAF415_00590 [Pseudomonadota bacterium]
MFENQPWYIVAVFAGIIGILVGWATETDDKDVKALNARLAAIEEMLVAQGETSSDAASAATQSAADLLEADKVLQAEIEAGIDAIAAGQEVLTQQHGVLGEGQAALDTKIAEMAARLDAIEDLAENLNENALTGETVTEAVAAAYAARHAAHYGKGHGEDDGEGGEQAASEEPAETSAAAPAQSEAVDRDDARHAELADAIGADGVILGVGQTAIVGDGRFFVSQITDEAVRGMVAGEDWADLSVFGGSVEVGGCILSLAGVHEGAAYMKPDC